MRRWTLCGGGGLDVSSRQPRPVQKQEDQADDQRGTDNTGDQGYQLPPIGFGWFRWWGWVFVGECDHGSFLYGVHAQYNLTVGFVNELSGTTALLPVSLRRGLLCSRCAASERRHDRADDVGWIFGHALINTQPMGYYKGQAGSRARFGR